jgi:hypothetical protein
MPVVSDYGYGGLDLFNFTLLFKNKIILSHHSVAEEAANRLHQKYRHVH